MTRAVRKFSVAAMLSAGAAVVVALAAVHPAAATHVKATEPMSAGHGAQLVIPLMDPMRGKRLFVQKGCVACHAANGVGGHDAPSMDAHREMGLVNPFDFAARMWNHAPAMIAAQQEALGDQVYFTGQELADLIAFVHDDAAQHSFSEDDLTPQARSMMHHQHHGMSGPEAHSEEIGHGKPHEHPPGTPHHND